MAENNNDIEQDYIEFNLNSRKDREFLQQVKETITESDDRIWSIIDSIEGSDKKKKKILFDDYFRLLDKFWGHPDTQKDAHVITMNKRMEEAAPYNLFFNIIENRPEIQEQSNSIQFTDFLCPSLGKLKCSLHMTYIASVAYILARFAKRKLHKLPMTIIYGYTGTLWPENNTMKELYPGIDHHFVEVDNVYGGHHTKLSIFVYDDDSLRVVVGSADLQKTWEKYNQQFWISPRCPKLPKGSSIKDGESPTGFKTDLLDYLHAYKNQKISTIRMWIHRVENTDFREIKVALVYTLPGIHYPRTKGSLVHFLGDLLARNCTIPAPKAEHDSWPVVVQSACLGLVGEIPDEWLTTNVLKALCSHKDLPYHPSSGIATKTKFNIIFPTKENWIHSKADYIQGVVYDKDVKDLQPWLLKHSCQWKADRNNRTRVMPLSKCYLRLSPCSQKMSYYFLSTANLSRSAWGSKPDRYSNIYVRSFEIGVLFLPKYFQEEYFEVMYVANRKNKRLFPIMFDLPLTPYRSGDDAFCPAETMRPKRTRKGSRV